MSQSFFFFKSQNLTYDDFTQIDRFLQNGKSKVKKKWYFAVFPELFCLKLQVLSQIDTNITWKKPKTMGKIPVFRVKLLKFFSHYLHWIICKNFANKLAYYTPHVLGIYLVNFGNFWKCIFCYLLSPP